MSKGNKYAMVAIALAGLVYVLSPMLTPFLTAALLAYLAGPLVGFLEKHAWPRGLAVGVVFAGVFSVLTAGLIVLVPLIEQQILSLIAKLPAMIIWVKEIALPWLQGRLGGLGAIDVEQLQQTLQDNMGSAGGMAAAVVGSLTSSGMALLSGLSTLLLIPVVTFYLLRDWDVMVDTIHHAFPRKIERKVALIGRDVDAVLGAFFKGQVLVMVSLAIIYSVGLSLAGLEFALLIGLIAGVVSFVPYLGLIIGLLLAVLVSVFQLHDSSGLMFVFAVFGVAQLLESVVLTPILVGDKIGLHPVAVIFAVMAGGQLFGFTGILLALPVAAVLLVLLRHLDEQYKSSELYTDT